MWSLYFCNDLSSKIRHVSSPPVTSILQHVSLVLNVLCDMSWHAAVHVHQQACGHISQQVLHCLAELLKGLTPHSINSGMHLAQTVFISGLFGGQPPRARMLLVCCLLNVATTPCVALFVGSPSCCNTQPRADALLGFLLGYPFTWMMTWPRFPRGS